jgi:hypothetical protein
MYTHRFLTALFTAILIAFPSISHARGPAQAPGIEFTSDIDESSLLGVRNGIALSGVLRAALADSTRTVTVVTDDAVVYEVSFDAHGQYTQVLNHGGRPGAEYEVAAAVRAFDRDTGYQAILAGDRDPIVDLELDIEDRLGSEVIGMVDVAGSSAGLNTVVVVDPTAVGFNLDWITQVVLPQILLGICADLGHMDDLWAQGSDDDDFTGSPPSSPDPGDSEITGIPRDFEDDDHTDSDGIAPWTEGPMMLVDEVDVLVTTEASAVSSCGSGVFDASL